MWRSLPCAWPTFPHKGECLDGRVRLAFPLCLPPQGEGPADKAHKPRHGGAAHRVLAAKVRRRLAGVASQDSGFPVSAAAVPRWRR